jgi:hypothetical protein
MQDDINKEFAKEVISFYGEDRFYHSSLQTGSFLQTKRVFHWLVGTQANFEEIVQKYKLHSLIFEKPFPFASKNSLSQEQSRSEMCRIVFSLCNNYKKFGLKSKIPPSHIQARMVLGEKNEWVEKYAKLMQNEDFVK